MRISLLLLRRNRLQQFFNQKAVVIIEAVLQFVTTVGNKKLYRIIDFKRNKDGIPATVATIEYDPNRSARIALVVYKDGEKRYIVAPISLKVGDIIQSMKVQILKLVMLWH